MARPSKTTTDQKLRVVLSVLRGEHSAVEAARRNGVSEQSVHNWKKQFLDAGREGLERGAGRRSSREVELESENEELKAGLDGRNRRLLGQDRPGMSDGGYQDRL